MPVFRTTSSLIALAAAATLTACDGGGGGGTGGSAPFVPAAHPAFPQVIDLGGRVLAKPKVQPIAYMSDPGLGDIEAFLKEMAKTTYWSEATSEYAVGPLTILPTIVQTTTPPSMFHDSNSDPNGSALQQTLYTNTSGADPAWGPADPSTIYLFVLPAGSIAVTDFGTCCQSMDGYHNEATAGTMQVPYAVTCACPGFDGPYVSDLQQRTLVISHELVEAVTDPFVFSDPAYVQEDDANVVWGVTGGEVADMCTFGDAQYILPDGTFMVQRSWSDVAAKKGHDPCVPNDPAAAYFNAVPALDKVSWDQVPTRGVRISVGQSKTIDLNLFSTAPMPGPFSVTVHDYEAFINDAAPKLALTLDNDTGQNGDTLHLTIRVMGSDPTLDGEAFIIYSSFGTAGTTDYRENVSMGLVVN